MKSKIEAAKSKIENLQASHAATLANADTILGEAHQAKSKAYDALLHARATGSGDCKELTLQHTNSVTALTDAMLESDVQRTVATQITAQITQAQDELTKAQAEYKAHALAQVVEIEKAATAKRKELFSQLVQVHLEAIAAQNRASTIRAEIAGGRITGYDLIPLTATWQIQAFGGIEGDGDFYYTHTTPNNQQTVERIHAELAQIGA